MDPRPRAVEHERIENNSITEVLYIFHDLDNAGLTGRHVKGVG
jgi:hypothetical protein